MIKQIPVISKLTARKMVDEQAATYGPAARSRLQAAFATRSIAYPPARVVFVALKDKHELQVYVAPANGKFVYVSTYPVLGASGKLGPKLREGDFQVPEGIYHLTLEPNTPYHLALRLNYPNEFDLAHAMEDGRQDPGSDILIHGSTGSIGCLAMGDPASEDLFLLANDAVNKDTQVVICPTDLRTASEPELPNAPLWLPSLYRAIKLELTNYPLP